MELSQLAKDNVHKLCLEFINMKIGDMTKVKLDDKNFALIRID